MLSKTLKRTMAAVLSAAMVFSSATTIFADETLPSTIASEGSILDFKVQTQVVPTAMKVAINPNGYAINVRYSKLANDATYSATTKYYTKSDEGVYSVATVTSDDFATNKATLYTAETSNNQIISFNYGLANTSTVARKITVTLDITADSKITFVDTAAKAANEAATDDGGAKKGEYKMFLQLVPAKAGEAMTANTYAKATAYAADTKYYTRGDDGKYTEATIANEDAFKASTSQLYTSTTTIGTEIQASELADVTMTNSTAPITFATDGGATKAVVAYSLPKATYTLKADQYLDFDSSTDGLANKFEMTGIGGLSGFTVTGSMNTNTEWSQLTTKTITITPTYKFEDATGLETAVSTGLNQIQAVPDVIATSLAYTSKNAAGDVTLTFTPGTAEKTLANTSFKINGVETSTWSSYSTNIVFNNNNTITVKAAVFGFNSIKTATTDDKYIFTVVDTDGTSYSSQEVEIQTD